jgi:hypothetical protein
MCGWDSSKEETERRNCEGEGVGGEEEEGGGEIGDFLLRKEQGLYTL